MKSSQNFISADQMQVFAQKLDENSFKQDLVDQKKDLETFVKENNFTHVRQLRSGPGKDEWEFFRIAFYGKYANLFDSLMNGFDVSGLVQEEDFYQLATELEGLLQSKQHEKAKEKLDAIMQEHSVQHVDQLRSISKFYENESMHKHLCTLLHVAAEKSFYELAKFLVEVDASVHALDHKYRTPLHSAATSNCVEIGRLLVAKGANKEARATSVGKRTPTLTPLMFSIFPLNVEFFSFLLDEGASVFSATSRYKKWEDDIPIEKRNHQPLHLIITRRGVAGVNDHDDFANRKIAMLRRILSNDVKPDLEALTIHKDKHMTPLKLAYALMQDVEVDCPKPKKIRLEENYRNIMTILKEAGADESVLDDEIGLEDRVKKIEKSVLAINLNGERSIKLFVFWSLFEIVRGIVRFSADVLGDNISDKYMDLHNKYSQALLSLLIACFIVIVFYFCEKNKSKTINPSGIKGCSVEEVEVPFTLR